MADPAQEKLDGAGLEGVWLLEAFEFTFGEDIDGSEVHRPLGETPVGSVMIQDGYLNLVFMAGDRAVFGTPDVMGGSDAEKVAASDTYVSFGGPCRVEGDVVVVDVAHSLFPNWVGREQRRRFVLDGDRLTLQTAQAIPMNGQKRWGRARLHRFGSGG